MSRIAPIDPARATGEVAAHLDSCRKMLGGTPNLFTTAAQSPAALGALVSLFGNLGKSSLGAKTGELIALTVAQSNGCGYCLSAHTAIGGSLGLSPDTLAAARGAKSADPRTAAALQLARAVNESRGHISDETFATARGAGLGDAQIVEVVAHVALNVFTNYLNSVAQTAIDFPNVSVAAAA